MPEPQYTPEELAQERWLPVPGYEGLYSVSDLGRFFSHPRKHVSAGRYLKHALTHDGYHFVGLSKKGVTEQFYVHKMVAESFVPNPGGLREADHKDRDHDNNRASNLRWATPAQNHANQNVNKDGTSKFKGVSYYSDLRCWVACVMVNGKQVRIGAFRGEIAAALAYDHATRLAYGEFAFDNSRTFGLAASVEEETAIINRDRIRKIYGIKPLLDTEAIAIRNAYRESPATKTEIALSVKYERSVATIRDIRKGRTFKHLPT